MADPTLTNPPRPRQIIVAPLNVIDPKDVAMSTKGFDGWLQQETGGYVSLARLKTVAGGVPVLGNIIALGDVLDDLASMLGMVAHDRKPGIDAWSDLAIDLIGVVPGSANAARVGLRPMLALVKQELANALRAEIKSGIQEEIKIRLGKAAIDFLEAHLNATIIGELEQYIEKAQAQLNDLLAEAGALGEQQVTDIATGMEQLILTGFDANGSPASAGQHVRLAQQANWYDVGTKIENYLGAAWDQHVAALKAGATLGKEDAIPEKTRGAVQQMVAKLKAFAPQIRGEIQALATSNAPQAIGGLLAVLLEAIRARRKGGKVSANVPASHVGEARHTSPQQPAETVHRNAPAEGSPGCKNCPAPAGTGPSISFATGDETLSHTDFTLPGLFPIAWTRTYRSSLGAYDRSESGARWITPYTVRFDVARRNGEQSLRYHAADGRSHAYPLPAVGKFHHDRIENVLLTRASETLLALSYGHDRTETYERHGERFHLIGITLRSGAAVSLYYEHRLEGEAASAAGTTRLLSDLITHQNGAVLTHIGIRPDAHGHIAELWQIADGKPVRHLSRYQYDEAGNLVMAQDENAAHWDYRYQNHLVTRYTDRTGRGMNLQWDGTAPTAKAIREWADDGSFDTRIEWDERVRLTYVTDAHGHETWHYYDIKGYTYRITHPDGRSEWLFRDVAKNVVQHVHPDGAIDRFAYDARGNLVEHIRPDHSAVHFAYDDKDQLIKVRDAQGGLWQRDYDLKGNVTEEIDPLGNKTEYAYNKAGLPVEITDAKGGKKQMAYNAAGQLTGYTDCSGKASAWKYDERGRPVKFTDAAGGVTQHEYEAGQLTRIVRPDQQVEKFERDAEGRLLAHTDPLHRRTTWRYNEAGLIASRSDAANQTLAYHWDKLGRLAVLTNENHVQCTFAYDPVGRLLSETGFDGKERIYRHERQTGRLVQVIEDRLLTVLDHDDMGRLTHRRAGLMDKTNTARNMQWENFTYDGNGRLILAENAGSRLQWFHDLAGNVTREHHHYRDLERPLVAVWRHEYDALNQRIATVRPDGHRVSVLTYGSGHVHGVLLDGQELVQFERDNLHREVSRTQGNRISQVQRYDAAGRLLEQTLWHLDNTRAYVNKRGYRYDNAGQLTDIQDTRRGYLSYRYDPVGRLLSANSALGEETFAFDPAGNLLTDPTLRIFAADPARGRPEFGSRLSGRPTLGDNLLKEYAGTHYAWDERGNLIQRIVNGVQEDFSWDGFNRLVEYSNRKLKARFSYDALGRRTWKYARSHFFDNPDDGYGWNRTERARLDKENGCAMTVYGWDGDVLAWESRANAEDVDELFRYVPGAARTTHYVYEPGSFVPLAQAVRQGQINVHAQPAYAGDYDFNADPLWHTEITPVPFDAVAYYQCDHLGTPQEITGPNGEIAWSAQYKAWGAAQETIGNTAGKAGIHNPLRFQGQYFDHETGLHYNRYRYYDPEVGRYVSKDPIGLLGGYNLYAYVRNAPTMGTDPLGLQQGFAGFDAPGVAQRASLLKWAIQEGYSPVQATEMVSPTRRPIATGECRAGATLAAGAGLSVGASVNEKDGVSVQPSIPMIAAGRRLSASCGLRFRDPSAESLKVGTAVGFSRGIVSVDITQTTSIFPEVYIGIGGGIGQEIQTPFTPSVNLPGYEVK